MNAPKKGSRPGRRRNRVRWSLLGLSVAAILVLGGYFAGPGWLVNRARHTADSDPRAAEEMLMEAIDRAGGEHPEAYLLLSRVLGMQGRWIEATGAFAVASESECDPMQVLQLAEEAQNADQWTLSEIALSNVERSGIENPEVVRRALPLLYGLGTHVTVIDWARQLQELSPDDPLGWEFEARAHEARGQLLKAIRAYEEALDRRPEHPAELRERLVELLLETGDVARARTEMVELLSETSSFSVRLIHVRLLQLEAKFNDALAFCEELLVERPGDPDVLRLRGSLYLDLDQPRAAVDDLVRAVADNPRDARCHFQLSQAYLRLGQSDKAREHLRQRDRLIEMQERIRRLEAELERDRSNSGLRFELAELYEEAARPPSESQ